MIPRNREAALSLVEVMVVLAVLAMSLAVLFKCEKSILGTTRSLTASEGRARAFEDTLALAEYAVRTHPDACNPRCRFSLAISEPTANAAADCVDEHSGNSYRYVRCSLRFLRSPGAFAEDDRLPSPLFVVARP